MAVFTPHPLYLRYQLGRRLGGPQSSFELFGGEILFSLSEFEAHYLDLRPVVINIAFVVWLQQ
jgi:hypothetical protein